MSRLCHRVLCDWLGLHTGPIRRYGRYSYIDCARCGALRQPMPHRYAEMRYGDS
jgi:hypothetical protein